MLVISRKNGQKVMINDNIEITVVECKNGSCKLAIQADKDVKIYREEIYLQIKVANLIGKDTNISSVASVADMIKGGTKLNDNIESTAKNDEEIILDEKPAKKTITVYKKPNDNAKSK